MTAPKKTSKKPHWLNVLAALFILASVLMAAYLLWQTYQLSQAQQDLITGIDSQKATLIELKKKEQIGERMKAAEILAKAQNYRQNWSEVVRDLSAVIAERSRIEISSVSVANDGLVSIQATAPDMLSVASLIILIERDDRFSSPFINNVSSKKSDSEESFNFGATFNYLADTE